MYRFRISKARQPGGCGEDAVRRSGSQGARRRQDLYSGAEAAADKPTVVVDLAKLGLTGITVAGDKVTIGAMTTHAAIANSAEIAAKIPGWRRWPRVIGDEAVRHRGTIGGSLANNDPAACYPARCWRWARRSRPTGGASQRTTSSRACSQRRWSRVRSSPRSNCRSRRSRRTRSSATRPHAMPSSACSWRRFASGVRARDHRRRAGRRVPPHRDGDRRCRQNSPRCDRGDRHPGGRAERRHPCQRGVSGAPGRRGVQARGGEGA